MRTSVSRSFPLRTATTRLITLPLLLLAAACSDRSSLPLAEREGPAFDHVPGTTLAQHVVSAEVIGTTARVIWHKDPALADGQPGKYLAQLFGSAACSGTTLFSYNGDAQAWPDKPGHLYLDFTGLASGSYCVRVKDAGKDAQEPYKDWVTATFSVNTVNPPSVNQPPTLGWSFTDFAGASGAAVHEGDARGFAVVADDEDGDVVTVEYSLASPAGTIVMAGSGTNAAPLTFAYTFPDNGTYVLRMRASDGKDAVMVIEEIVVENVAPELGEIAVAPAVVQAVNAPFSLGLSFTDPGQDTWSCTVSWGDGAQSSPDCSARGSTASHAYSAAGIYTVRVSVSDDDAGTDAATYEYLVVYDPSAGFVTGGGWLNSTAGMYRIDPLLSGKATFGFVSKYVKGATTPSGNTEFQFHAAGMTFRSTSYQWLVVSGTKATYKGEGMLNGTAGYGFLLSAIDGTPDRFRIKIWSIASGDVAYDNLLANAGDDADPTTAIGSGSIIIHTGKK